MFKTRHSVSIKPSTYTLGVIAIFVSSYFLLQAAIPIIIRYRHPLANAIRRGDVDAVRRAINEGADVNRIDSTLGSTMLTLACDYGRVNEKLVLETPELRLRRIYDMLDILTDAGADLNATDEFGFTVLFLITNRPYFHHPPSPATVEKQKEIVAMLIRKGADFNVKCQGLTPLHNAVAANDLEVIKLLVEAGADVNAKYDRTRDTVLDVALATNNREVIEYLREHGAKE